MQERYNSFDALENELLERLKARGCSSITVTGYRYLCNSIISWLKDNGLKSYTKESGNAFLQDYLSEHGNNQYYSNLRTVVYRLNDLVDGKWEDVHSDKGKHFILSDEFIDIVNKYCSHETAKGLASGTIKYKRYAISWFFHELGMLQYFSLTQLSPKSLVQACTKITDHNLWSEVRLFLRYLVLEEKLETDYSTLVPHYSKPYVIPSVYSIDEVKRIENFVDTSTIQGKRDYAIILLASRMGLRSGDIVRLKIEDIKGKDEIILSSKKQEKHFIFLLLKKCQRLLTIIYQLDLHQWQKKYL